MLRMMRPSSLYLKIEALVMNRTWRRVTVEARAKSRLERCTGASTNGPSLGTFSLPSTRSRK